MRAPSSPDDRAAVAHSPCGLRSFIYELMPDNRPLRVLIIAMWFGIVAGLVEGTGLLAIEKLPWLVWMMPRLSVSAEIIWICLLFDLILFGVLGVVLPVIAWASPRLPIMWTSIRGFS